jgi:YidC/Oxa1 family membrane protein insertase
MSFIQDNLAFVIHPLELGVIALSVWASSAGIGIILFTILVRLALSPLTITQLRNAKAMQRVQPLVAELRQKHGKDKQALSQATMALYKEHRVNPAMGCLPTLLQLPILIGLFYAFLNLGKSKPAEFPRIGAGAIRCSGHLITNQDSWLSHCYRVANAVSNPDHIYNLFHSNFLWLSNGLGKPDPLLILPILAGVTQWIQMRMMATQSNDPQQKMMNSFMNFMPLFIVYFATRYASGLSLYWVTSTVIGIAIQYRITGWGLLPRPAAVFALLGGNAPASRSRSSRSPGAAKPRPNSSKANTTKKPATTTEVSGQTEALLAPAEGEEGIDLNGQDGQRQGAEGPQKRTGTDGRKTYPGPRKRANRARGGRRGGRRG